MADSLDDQSGRVVLTLPDGRSVEGRWEDISFTQEGSTVWCEFRFVNGRYTLYAPCNYEAAWRPDPDAADFIQTTRVRAKDKQEVLDHLASHWDVDPAEVVYIKSLKEDS